MTRRVRIYKYEDDPTSRIRLGVATTDHAASSYGLPVIVIGGQPYGAADLGPEATVMVLSDHRPTDD